MAKKAELGQKVLFKGAVTGTVDKVNDNSVIVSILENKTDLVFDGGRTVVNHKNYKIIK